MIEVQSLTRRFGHTAAVDDVSFHIDSNEVVGLLGHNGAGKTTIMRMLSGYLEPSSGQVLIDGYDMARDPRHIQEMLGYLPENLPVYPDMSIADYMDYAATLKCIPRSERIGAIRDALAATELLERALDRIGTLSRGLRQRVGVAQAVLGRPQLLILDEPTNGLDPRQTAHMRALITEMSQQSTVILSTHIMQEVNAVCDRVLILRNGRLALDRKLSELQDKGSLVLRASACPDSLLLDLQSQALVAAVATRPAGDDELYLDIQLQDGSDRDATASDIAALVIRAGAKLHRIDMPSQDLESVFQEVHDRGN